jgi:uncharacterized membrane protein
MKIENVLKGTWLGHPLHPIFAHIPAALWPSALVFDILTRFGVGGNALVRLSFYCVAFGLAAALCAAPAGLMDFRGVKRKNPAWKIGMYHGVLNAIVTITFITNLTVRVATFRTATEVDGLPFALSVFGAVLLCVSVYLGGRLVYGYGINVARMSKEKWRRRAEAGGANLPERSA